MSDFRGKALAEGEVQTAIAALFTAVGDRCTYIKSFSLYNKNAATQTCTVYLNIGGNRRFFRRFVFLQNESADVVGEGDTLEFTAGDMIEAITTTANAVDFVITGVEENA